MENCFFFERVLEFFRQKTVAVAVEILGEASPHRAGNSGRLSAECCWFMERLTRTSWAQAKQCCDWIDRNTDLRNSQTGWTLGVARDTFARNFCSSFGIALLRKESFLGGLLNSYPIPGSLHRTQVFCSTPSILVWVVEWQDPTSASQNRVLWIFLVSGFAILLYESFHQVSKRLSQIGKCDWSRVLLWW